MYPIRKRCTTFGSILKEGLHDRRFLSRTRFKAHTVVENETWILVRAVLAADVRLSNSIMSDINVCLQTFQCWYNAPNNYCTYPIEGDIEDRADQRRLSNTGLDHFEHITEGINGITDIPN
jgi:hypothetical protein